MPIFHSLKSLTPQELYDELAKLKVGTYSLVIQTDVDALSYEGSMNYKIWPEVFGPKILTIVPYRKGTGQ